MLSRNSKLLLRGFLQRTTKQDHSLGDLDFQAFSRCLPQLILALIFENEKTFSLSNLKCGVPHASHVLAYLGWAGLFTFT